MKTYTVFTGASKDKIKYRYIFFSDFGKMIIFFLDMFQTVPSCCISILLILLFNALRNHLKGNINRKVICPCIIAIPLLLGSLLALLLDSHTYRLFALN